MLPKWQLLPSQDIAGGLLRGREPLFPSPRETTASVNGLPQPVPVCDLVQSQGGLCRAAQLRVQDAAAEAAAILTPLQAWSSPSPPTQIFLLLVGTAGVTAGLPLCTEAKC